MDNKKPKKPFYALPENIPTSAQIVNAARSSLRTFDTKRPNTPREEQRHLFPLSTNRAPETRPPSAFSLSSRHFEGSDSRPVSGTRLSPLDYHPKPISPIDSENILVPRPPAVDPYKVPTRRGSGKRTKLPSTQSEDGPENHLFGFGQGDAEYSEDKVPDDMTVDISDFSEELTGATANNGNESRESSAGSKKSSKFHLAAEYFGDMVTNDSTVACSDCSEEFTGGIANNARESRESSAGSRKSRKFHLAGKEYFGDMVTDDSIVACSDCSGELTDAKANNASESRKSSTRSKKSRKFHLAAEYFGDMVTNDSIVGSSDCSEELTGAKTINASDSRESSAGSKKSRKIHQAEEYFGGLVTNDGTVGSSYGLEESTDAKANNASESRESSAVDKKSRKFHLAAEYCGDMMTNDSTVGSSDCSEELTDAKANNARENSAENHIASKLHHAGKGLEAEYFGDKVTNDSTVGSSDCLEESTDANNARENRENSAESHIASKLHHAAEYFEDKVPNDSTVDSSDCSEELTDAKANNARENSAENHIASKLHHAGKIEAQQDPADVYKRDIEPLVLELSSHTKKKDYTRAHEFADLLNVALEKNNCFSKQFQHRASLLTIIFKLLDVDEPRVLLKLARLILAFKVGNNNLLTVCKLVFKISRNEKNDSYFLEENILNLLLETIRSADVTHSCEALVYLVGAVKFLTMNEDVLKRLAKLDCIKTLAQLMHSINKINRDNDKPGDQFGNILVQLTASLRNLANTSSGRDRFLTHNVIEGLVLIMESYSGDGDLIMYISRIFSKITLHPDCCSVLANLPQCYKAFVSLLKRHLLKDDLVVRLCFVIGNLTIKNDAARLKFFQENNLLETLLLILKTYFELDRQGKTTASGLKEDANVNRAVEGEIESQVTIVEDVLIKVMRVIANLTINEDVGLTISENNEFMKLLLKIIDEKDITCIRHEEVIINAVVAINNLSYYIIQNQSQISLQLNIATSLLKLLMINNMEGILEAARVFGNLTRHKQIRDYLSQKKVDAMMVTLLDSNNRELVYIACGVLINFMLDEEKRPVLLREGGIKKLIEVLRDFGKEDWQLSGCVCKVLVNYSSRIHSSSNSFGQEEAIELSELLTEYIDKDLALGETLANVGDDEMKEYIEDVWHEEFYSVGAQLLKRIESHLSPLEPLEAPS
ncbi:Armadillo repeat-containing protein 2 [Bulinus truncatus]|nr:Armadillo repeat-containing protein 2 [Bulinus truncatus]